MRLSNRQCEAIASEAMLYAMRGADLAVNNMPEQGVFLVLPRNIPANARISDYREVCLTYPDIPPMVLLKPKD